MANWYCGSDKYATVAQWAASTTYSVGQIVRQLATPAVGSERCFRVSAITTGISGATEPSWNTGKAATTADSGVTWTECTGQNIYNGDGGGTAFAAPHKSIANAQAWTAAGDKIYVTPAHAYSQTTTITYNNVGSITSPVQIICVASNSVVPPTGTATTATETSTAGTISFANGNSSYAYWYGISFIGSGTTGTGFTFSPGVYYQTNQFTFEQCVFNMSTTSTTAKFNMNGNTCYTKFNGCTFLFGATAQYLNLSTSNGVMENCVFASSGTVPTYVFFGDSGTYPYSMQWVIRDCDFSAITTSIYNVNGNQVGGVYLENCKINGTGTVTTNSYGLPGAVGIRMHNCDSAATNYRFYDSNFFGTLQSETTIVRTGGATNGTTPESFNITATVNATYAFPFSTDAPAFEEITQWNDVTGVSKTVTVYLTSNATLDNSKCWIEVEYPSSSSTPIGGVISTRAPLIGSATTLTTDSSTWGGSITNKYSISATFTPQMKGPIKVRIYVAGTTTPIYVDPLPVIV